MTLSPRAAMTPRPKRSTPPVRHADGGTDRAESPALEGRIPLPAEITGLSAGSDEDLVALFGNGTDAHLADGFRGGNDDDPAEPDETRPDRVPPVNRTSE